MNNHIDFLWQPQDEYLSGRNRRRLWRRLMILGQRLVTLTAVVLAIAYVQTVSANEQYASLSEIESGTLVYKAQGSQSYQAAVLLATRVDMRVSGPILRAQVEQHFSNTTAQWQEGIYVFPLPDNAAVDRLQMRVGERVIEGQIKERTEAKKIYVEAKRSGKAASLVEQERPNMFTTSVANIPPQGRIVVKIEYQQTLRYDNGEFRLRFPLAITPRYIPGESADSVRTGTGWSADTDRVPDASRITQPFVYNTDKKVNPVQIRVELDSGMPLESLASPSHAIETTAHGEGRSTIRLAAGQQPADRDFVLHWQPHHDDQPRSALFTEHYEGKAYHLLMVLPPEADKIDQPLGRDVIFVIDTSGSMGGVSIRQARQALSDALSRLRLQDRFNIIQFNSVTRALFDDVRPASVMNIARARQYVSHLSAGGGTEMRPALRRALDPNHDHRNVRQVIFLTDGSVGNESELFNVIHNRLADSRLYTIGIGSAPNSYFMRKAAEFGRGTYTYIDNVKQVRAKMDELFRKLAHPVLQNLQAEVEGDGQAQLWPRHLRDVYAGEPLMLSLRTATAHGTLALRGQRGPQSWQRRLQLDTARAGVGMAGLWARNKIEALMDRIHEGHEKQRIRDQVVDVALRHHLVSRFTSLVAVDVTRLRRPDAALNKSAVPGNIPHGQKDSNYVPAVAQTATPMSLLLLSGGLLLLAGLALRSLAADRKGEGHAC